MGMHIPALLPVGSGLLANPMAALPAGCGVIFYYFIDLVREQSAVLQNQDTEIPQKLKVLMDGLMKNQEMWMTMIAFVAVILLVYAIRTRAFDYAWRVSIVAGGVTYIFLMLVGGLFLNVQTSILELLIFSVIAILIGMVLELFVFGGDYSRTERLEYEDEEYYYYVKAVPKATVATSERNIKKINAAPEREEEKDPKKKGAEYVVSRSREQWEPQGEPLDSIPTERIERDSELEADALPLKDVSEIKEVDFEKKLEESLKDL